MFFAHIFLLPSKFTHIFFVCEQEVCQFLSKLGVFYVWGGSALSATKNHRTFFEFFEKYSLPIPPKSPKRQSTGRHREIQHLGYENFGCTPNP